MTLAEHIARLKQEFPTLTATEDGIERTLSPEEYEVRIAEWAANEVAREQAEADAETRREIRRKARRALTTLDDDITRLADTTQGLTIAQARPIMLRQARISKGIIEALVSLGLLEDDA